MEIFKLFGKIAVDNSEANRAIDETVGNVGNAEPRMTKALKKIGAAVVAAFAVDKIKDFGKACISAGMDFDSQMSTVAAISGATGEEFEILRAKAQEMGATTAFSATESAQAMEYMAMAGWKTTDITNGLAGVMNLAAASGEDLATTSDIVTDAMTAFGMSADQSTYFADVLAQTATNANTNVGMMGETFKYVAPLAGTLGYSVEDMSIGIGLMANAGIKGSQAGTTLKTAIANMTGPTDKQAAAMEDLGISLENANGGTKSFMEVMENLRSSIGGVDVELVDSEGNLREYDDIIADLSKSTEGLSKVQQIQAASTIFGKESMSGMLAIISASEEDFDKLTESIYNADGAAKGMSEIKLDNLAGDVTYFKSALEGAQIAISDKLTPVLRNLVKKATDWLPKIQKSIIAVIDKLEDKFGPLIKRIKNIAEESDITEKSISFLKEAFEKTVDVMSEIGDKFLDFIEWLSKGSRSAENFKGVVKGVIAGLLAFKTVNAVISKGKEIVSAYKRTMDILKSSNPFSWVSVGIAAIVALGAAVKSKHDSMVESFRKLDDETQKHVDKTNELIEKNKDLIQTFNDNNTSIKNEYDSYRDLASELDNLVDENGRVTDANKERVDYILGELNDALGTEYSLTGNQIDGYKDLQEEIKETMLLKEAETLLDSQRETYYSYKDSLDDDAAALASLYSDRDQLELDLFNAKAALDDELDSYSGDQGLAGFFRNLWNDDKAQEKVDGIQAQIDEVDNRIAEHEKTVAEKTSSMKTYSDLSVATASGNLDSIAGAVDNFHNNMLRAGQASQDLLDQQVLDEQTKYDNMVKASKKGNSLITKDMMDSQGERVIYAKEQAAYGKFFVAKTAEEQGDAYAGGLKSKEGDVKQAGNDLGDAASNSLNSVDAYSIGASKGNDLVNGVLSIVYSSADTISNALSVFAGNIHIGSSGSYHGGGGGSYSETATGGIVTRAQTRLVGEDGAEAIVPLENNTEWIDKVAAKVTDSMGGAPSNTAILNKLNELIEVIKGQKVYLDSGALVGEIAPAMDGALGNISRMKRRGLR